MLDGFRLGRNSR